MTISTLCRKPKQQTCLCTILRRFRKCIRSNSNFYCLINHQMAFTTRGRQQWKSERKTRREKYVQWCMKSTLEISLRDFSGRIIKDDPNYINCITVLLSPVVLFHSLHTDEWMFQAVHVILKDLLCTFLLPERVSTNKPITWKLRNHRPLLLLSEGGWSHAVLTEKCKKAATGEWSGCFIPWIRAACGSRLWDLRSKVYL